MINKKILAVRFEKLDKFWTKNTIIGIFLIVIVWFVLEKATAWEINLKLIITFAIIIFLLIFILIKGSK